MSSLTYSRASSGSPYEDNIGFSRAVRVEERILVSGTAPVEADGSSTPGDAEAQARRCFGIILAAVAELGGTAADVVRTRMFLVDADDADAVGPAHGAVFGDVRPAATMVVVSALLRPEWRVGDRGGGDGRLSLRASTPICISSLISAGGCGMKVQVGRWGNSLAVRLPKSLVDRFQLNEGAEIELSGLEAALEAEQRREIAQRREKALEDIASAGWTLPPDWKFDREEANWRPAMDRW